MISKSKLLCGLLLLALSAPGLAHSADVWSTRDKYLESTYLVFHTLDWLQTKDIAASKEYHETNLVLGRHPHQSTVDLYFIGTGLAHVGLVHLLPREYRPWFQAGTLALEVYCVQRNYSLGVRLKF